MDYIVEIDNLFRILDDGSKQKLGWVTDNGRGQALAVTISPIHDEWLEDCKKHGIPSCKKNGPIPFWDDGKDIERAFEEFYKKSEDYGKENNKDNRT